MKGDCSTCGYSVGNQCQCVSDCKHSLDPLPCPTWMPQGEQWKIMQEAWYKRNPWPFKTNSPCNQNKS